MTEFRGTATWTHEGGRMVKTETGREIFEFVPKYRLDGDVVVSIDVEKLIHILGQKALSNKSKIVREIGGIVEVRAFNVKKTDL